MYLFTFSDSSFSGGRLAAVVGKGYTGDSVVDVGALETDDGFGASVSLNGSGDRLAVGAYRDDGAGNGTRNAGAVYLFTFSDSSFSGGRLAAVVGEGYTGGPNVDVAALEDSDYLGRSVSLNAAGNRLAVGASLDDGAGNGTGNAGAVYLFTFSDSSFSGGRLAAVVGKAYTGEPNVDVTALEESDYFGFSVSLNAAGDRLAVGAVGGRRRRQRGHRGPERYICSPSPTAASRAGGWRRWRARATRAGPTSMSPRWRPRTGSAPRYR